MERDRQNTQFWVRGETPETTHCIICAWIGTLGPQGAYKSQVSTFLNDILPSSVFCSSFTKKPDDHFSFVIFLGVWLTWFHGSCKSWRPRIFCNIIKALIYEKSSSCSTNDVRPFKHMLCRCAVSSVSPLTPVERTQTGWVIISSRRL
jgi:hypothetical protein